VSCSPRAAGCADDSSSAVSGDRRGGDRWGLLNPEGNRFTAGLAGCGRGSPAGAPARPLRSQSRNAPAHSWQMTRGLRIQLRKSPLASSVEWRSISTSPQRMQQSLAMREVYSAGGSQTRSTSLAAIAVAGGDMMAWIVVAVGLGIWCAGAMGWIEELAAFLRRSGR